MAGVRIFALIISIFATSTNHCIWSQPGSGSLRACCYWAYMDEYSFYATGEYAKHAHMHNVLIFMRRNHNGNNIVTKKMYDRGGHEDLPRTDLDIAPFSVYVTRMPCG